MRNDPSEVSCAEGCNICGILFTAGRQPLQSLEDPYFTFGEQLETCRLYQLVFLSAGLFRFLDGRLVSRVACQAPDICLKSWILRKSAHSSLDNLQRETHQDICRGQILTTKVSPLFRCRIDLRLDKGKMRLQVEVEFRLHAANVTAFDAWDE